MSDEEVDVLPKCKNAEDQTKISVEIFITPPEEQEEPDSLALKRLFTVALETRNFEISQLVQRNNFFMIFQGVLLAGIIQSNHSKPVVSFLVSIAGLVVSLCQVKMAAGAKFWQEYWEAALQNIEKELIENLLSSKAHRKILFKLFHDTDHIYESMVKNRLVGKGLGLTQWLVMKRFSVSRVPIYVAIAFSVIWALLLLCTMRGYPPFSTPSFVVGF